MPRPSSALAIASDKLSESELTDLVNNVIEDRLAAVEGVAAANSYGLRAKTIEVRVSQVALAARGLSLSDVITTIGKASDQHARPAPSRTRRSSCWCAPKPR